MIDTSGCFFYHFQGNIFPISFVRIAIPWVLCPTAKWRLMLLFLCLKFEDHVSNSFLGSSIFVLKPFLTTFIQHSFDLLQFADPVRRFWKIDCYLFNELFFDFPNYLSQWVLEMRNVFFFLLPKWFSVDISSSMRRFVCWNVYNTTGWPKNKGPIILLTK